MRRTANSAWGRPTQKLDAPTRTCDQPGCPHAGEYRAPRSRDDLNSYFWFCLDHVRAYNAKWDYYAGMTADQIERAMREDVTWQRPTWPLGDRVARRVRMDGEHVHIHDPFGFFNDDEAGSRPRPRRPEAPEDSALRVLDLRWPLTVAELKSRYKELVKLHHPDRNGGDKAAEERFKDISQAYKTLLDSLNA